MMFKHDFQVRVTIGLDSCLMKLLAVLLGDDENKVASATAVLKQHTDNLSNAMSGAQNTGQKESSS